MGIISLVLAVISMLAATLIMNKIGYMGGLVVIVVILGMILGILGLKKPSGIGKKILCVLGLILSVISIVYILEGAYSFYFMEHILDS